MLTDALTYCQARIVATVLAPGMNERGAVRKHPNVLAAARQSGREALLR